MAKLLVVEDYVPLSSALEDWLTHELHVVEVVGNGLEALHRLRVSQYDLVVLDLSLPGLSGLEVCHQYRDRGGSTPIIILTGRGSVDDKAAGLDTGADDYLVKPFEFKELSARIRALIRRTSDKSTNVIEAGPLTLNLQTHQITRSGVQLHLTPREMSILELLVRHPSHAFTAEALMERVWTSNSSTSLDTVRSYIRMLRRKIDMPGQRSLIATAHGTGYKLDVSA